jgi:hypothetical protein
VLDDDVRDRAATLASRPIALQTLLEMGVLKTEPEEEVSLPEFRSFVAGVESTLRDGLSVFMDTTTVFVGNALLDGDGTKLSAINLLDLDTFIRNVVLCDFIHTLPSRQFDHSKINDKLGEPVFLPLPSESISSDRVAFLNDIWREAEQTQIWALSNPSEDAELVREQWQVLLGEPLTASAGRPAAELDWAEHPILAAIGWLMGHRKKGWRRADAPDGVRALAPVEWDWKAVDRDDLRFGTARPILKAGEGFAIREAFRTSRMSAMAAQANTRAAFNTLLANDIGLAYSPGLTRMPIFNRVVTSAARLNREMKDSVYLRDKLGNAGVPLDPGPVGPTSLELPLFLAVLLRESSSADDFWRVLADMRRAAVAYRRRRAQELSALHRNRTSVTEFKAALSDDGRVWRREGFSVVTAGAMTVTGGIIGGTTGTIIASLAGIVVAGRLDPNARAALRRRFRPHQWYLTSLAATADGALRDVDRVAELWRVKLPDDFARDLGRIGRHPELLGP